MSKYIGIDLGTTFSAVATLDETGRPIIVHNTEGANITPSVVWLRDDGTFEVGEEARKVWGIDTTRAAARFKRHMGSDDRYAVGGRSLSPTELSAEVLRRLAADTREALGELADVVVTIPANFAHEAREATLAAARDAGLRVRYIINEPTAAALYYAYRTESLSPGLYGVFDLGGGTFDVSIIKVDGRDVDVISTNGVARLGGADFDAALQELVARKYQEKFGVPIPEGEYGRNEAESDKRSLSRRDRVSIQVGRGIVEVTRAEFETAISTYLAQIEMLVESTIDEASARPSDLKGVFLVGGSTRMPCVQAVAERAFGQKPQSTANVDEVVALGAALYAAYKSDGTHLNAAQSAALRKIKVTESTGKCFGTLVQRRDPLRGITIENTVLIRKGEKIPCSVTEKFYTVHEGQRSVECEVTESTAEERDPRFVRIVWKGDLELPPGRPAQQEIAVTFAYDENQTMKCSFVDVATGRRTDVDLSFSDSNAQGESDPSRFLVE